VITHWQQCSSSGCSWLVSSALALSLFLGASFLPPSFLLQPKCHLKSVTFLYARLPLQYLAAYLALPHSDSVKLRFEQLQAQEIVELSRLPLVYKRRELPPESCCSNSEPLATERKLHRRAGRVRGRGHTH
jgi:hypothetical protein